MIALPTSSRKIGIRAWLVLVFAGLAARGLAGPLLASGANETVALGNDRAEDPEAVAQYTIGEWSVPGFGNARARVAVAGKAEVVWAHVPWRRRDRQPEKKGVLVVDAATGKRVANVVVARVSRESGDLLFEPVTVPGEYWLYYLPFRTVGEWYCPSTLYLAPTNTAGAAWASACAPVAERIREGKPAGVAPAQLIDLQAIDDFHRFDPMEITATARETSGFLAKHAERAFLLFPEDRRYPIRMKDELPLRWVQAGPEAPFKGEACRGEFYCFQVGLYACSQAVKDVSVAFEDLAGTGGGVIPGSAIRCFNLAGTNWLGKQIHKTVDVPKGKVQAFWLGLAVPAGLSPQTFRGKLRFAAANAPAVAIPIELKVSETLLADAGDSEISRQSRLRWLDSTIGLDDEAFAPYRPVGLRDRTVSVLGRVVHFNDRGLLDRITSTFSRNVDGADAAGRELLAGPIEFAVDTASGVVNWSGGDPRILGETTGSVAWEAASAGGPLRFECRAKLECDGYVNFKLTLRALKASEVKDIRLEIPLRREVSVYMMGLGRKGGYRPASWDWKWDAERANNQFWIGDVNAGLSCKLKHVEDRWDLANLKESGPYRDWSNDGRGGCNLREEGERVVVRAFTGPRRIAEGEALHFNFGLLITPVKTLDPAHWHWRYFHQGSSRPVAEVAKTGATIINLHQGDALNPYINYPFLTAGQLSAYTREAHARNLKVKLYYTIRELSDYTGEFWALRSLGNEVFTDGPGFQLADHFAADKPGQAPLKTGDSWLCEHVVSGYVPAWHTPLGNGRTDAALATAGLSRWHNYYLEGLSWMIRKIGIDGLYLDGIGYDREIMKRVRKVMQREGRGCLIDFHSGNNFHPEYGLNNCANQYLELFPCIDSLWFGEGFNYDEPPDYWMVEIAGIPYGLFGEMLQGGGNPWRGMLFGMTGRLGWGGNPAALWRVWDEFGIQDAKMSGFWDPRCPVKTGLTNVLATAYVKKGKTLISLASWAAATTRVRLELDYAALGLDAKRANLYAPAIPGFQPEAIFKTADDIPVQPGKGWLLLVEEAKHGLSTPAGTEPGGKPLPEERQATHSACTRGRSLEKILTQGRVVREARGASERGARFLGSIQQPQQMATRGPEWLIVDDAALRQSLECIETGGRIACLRQRHRTTHRGADAGREPHEAFVEQSDFVPVNVPGFSTSRMNGLDGGLQLVMARPAERCGGPQKFFGFFHQIAQPACGVLLVERDEFAGARKTRLTPGLAVQHQGEQPQGFRFRRHQLNERAPEHNGFRCQGTVR